MQIIPVPQTPQNSGLTTLLRFLDLHFEITDWTFCRLVLSVAIAHQIPGEMLWVRVNGNSRGGKTTILDAIARHSDSTDMEAITPASIRGGFKGGKRLLDRLDGKLVITKDIAALLTAKREARNEVFGLLRNVKDGKLTADYGTLEGHVAQQAKFDWLIGTTPVFAQYRQMEDLLGARFVDLQWMPGDREEMALRAAQNNPIMTKIRDALAQEVCDFIDEAKKNLAQNPPVPLSQSDLKAISNIADLTALLRSPGFFKDCPQSRLSVDSGLGEADRAELVEDTVAGLPYGTVNTYSVVDFISKRKGRREYRGDLLQKLDAESLRLIFAEYERKKEERNELDFDDLILNAVELLEQSEWVRQLTRVTYPHIEVDELQDTSLLQLTMIQLLYEHGQSQVFAVADDDQMVYEWRDARPETLNEFEEHFAPETVILRYNYRCPKNIVNVANRLIARNPDRHAKLVLPVREDQDGRITLSHRVDRAEQALFVADEILSAVADRKRTPQDHVVLVRYRRSFRLIEDALDSVNLPFVEIGGKDVEYSPFVRLLN